MTPEAALEKLDSVSELIVVEQREDADSNAEAITCMSPVEPSPHANAFVVWLVVDVCTGMLDVLGGDVGVSLEHAYSKGMQNVELTGPHSGVVVSLSPKMVATKLGRGSDVMRMSVEEGTESVNLGVMEDLHGSWYVAGSAETATSQMSLRLRAGDTVRAIM